jgi:hypothetical protein
VSYEEGSEGFMLNQLTVPILKERLKAKGLSVRGNKDTLVARLLRQSEEKKGCHSYFAFLFHGFTLHIREHHFLMATDT